MTWCDSHYLLDNCLGVGTQPTHPTSPSTVWVAVAVYTKSVVVRTQQAPATTPISGRMSIFDRAATTTQTTFRAEVLCIGTKQECEIAVQAHRMDGVEYAITEHRVGLDPLSAKETPGNPQSTPCIGCGVPVSGGPVKCQKCIEQTWAEQRAAFAASGGVQE